ncbi:hypothetical protein GCM10009841_34400 [Microlunatus panaciterrae]|uniref:Uncharacterized protein n=1 Tax=Microlunatus panaciterrae TaxID=400768 RepID=A0ABS2RH94_9ACTN|nr:hypothetical protein [Microlunatus panaciterrae]MBM7798098.1 hypothetical protein [Microlunatus panaciterrae]
MTGRRRGLALAVVGVALTASASCQSANISEKDAYAIGCPAIDTVIATGSLGSKAVVAGLKGLRSSSEVSAETRSWLDAAIGLLESANPDALPPKAKRVLLDGCAHNGHPLQNLT